MKMETNAMNIYQIEDLDLEFLSHHKISAEQAADHFARNEDTYEEGLKIFKCARELRVYRIGSENQLSDTWYCGHHSCPVCQWRKSLKFSSRMHRLLDQHPSLLQNKWLYLTLTVRNCPIEELRSTIEHMNQAFRRLMNRDLWKKNVAGGIKYIAVDDAGLETEFAQPYFHCLLLVSASIYEMKDYVSEIQWAAEWQQALQVQYSPRVNCCRLKGIDLSLRNRIIWATGHSMKPTETAFDQNWFIVTSTEMRGLRLVESFGTVLVMLSDLDGSFSFEAMEELEDIRENNDASIHIWDRCKGKYRPD